MRWRNLHRRNRRAAAFLVRLSGAERRARKFKKALALARQYQFEVYQKGKFPDYGLEDAPRQVGMVILRSNYTDKRGTFHVFFPVPWGVLEDTAFIEPLKDRAPYMLAQYLVNAR